MNQLYVHTYSLPLEPPFPPSHLSRSSQSTKLSSLCYAILQNSLYILHDSVYMTILLSQFILPSPSSLRVHMSTLYVCSANGFICSIFPDSIYTFICNIFFFSFWLTSLWQTLGTCTSFQKTQFCSFLWLSNIPLYVCTTSSLSLHLPLDRWRVFPCPGYCSAAMNIRVYVSFWIMVFLGYTPRSGIARSCGIAIFSF